LEYEKIIAKRKRKECKVGQEIFTFFLLDKKGEFFPLDKKGKKKFLSLNLN